MLVLLIAWAAPAAVGDNQWTNATGNGVWDSISANWSSPVTWNNGAVDVAVFGTNGIGDVTLGEPITLSGIRFEAPGYLVTTPGNANFLQLPSSTGGMFQTDADAAIAARITGGGQFVKNGEATLTLADDNSYSGGTIVNAGTLQIGGGGTKGSVSHNITNHATVSYNRSNDFTVFGIMSGNGSVNKVGAGTLILAGSFLHSGGTTVNEGILQVGNATDIGVLTGPVVNNATVTFPLLTGTRSYDGNMSGSGTLIKSGSSSSTLILTGNNTYAGGTSVLNGTLQIGSGGATGSISGDVAIVSGTLNFNRHDAATFGGNTSGVGLFQKSNSNTLTLTGNLTHTGGTTISGGTLSIGDGGITGTVAGNITNGANLTFNRSDSLTYGGVISGAGSLKKLGAGTLTLTGTAASTGGTTVSGGVLSIGNGSTTGVINGDIVNNTSLIFNRSNNISYSSRITGPGAITKLGDGKLTILGNLLHSGGTTVSAGTLEIGSGSSRGQLTGDVLNNAAVLFSAYGSTTYPGNMSGSGTVTIDASTPTVIFTGTNTYTGGTTITEGTLSIGDGGASGSIGGSVSVNVGASLVFDRSDASTFSGSISASGSVRKYGLGTLSVIGSKSGSGTTTIHEGTLSVGNGGTSGSWSGNVTNNANMTFNRSNNITYAGVISGPGSVTKLGGGTLTFTSAHTYMGGTTVAAGVLTLGDGAASLTFSGDILNQAVVSLNGPGFYRGNLSGSGAITKNGSGTYIVWGNLLHAGGTTVNGGVLQIGNGEFLGSLSGNVIVNSGRISFARADSFHINQLISGNGGFIKDGEGTAIVTANNTYIGDTSVLEGALQIGNGGAAGEILGNASVSAGAAMTLHRSDDVTLKVNVTGAGSFTKLGSNKLTLASAVSVTGGVTISGGVLTVGDGGSSGSISSNIVNNGSLIFDRATDSAFSGNISGPGSVDKRGEGRLGVSGVLAHTGGTTISQGTLQLGTGGNLTGSVVNNSAITYVGNAGQSPLVLPANISGTGSFTKTSSTSLVSLSGTNTYSGGTSVLAGTLQVGNGSAAGSIVGNVFTGDSTVGIGTLAFNRSDPIEFNGIVSGTGHLRKLGAGSLTLRAPHTYTGITTIEAGALVLSDSASISGSTAIETLASARLDVSALTGGLNFENGAFSLTAGQTLRGLGAVGGSVEIQKGAHFSPGLTTGARTGTLTVEGDLTFLPGSALNIVIGFPFDADSGRGRALTTGELAFAGDAEHPFSINLTRRTTSSFGNFVRPLTIAAAASIDSVGLDDALLVEIGPDGAGIATNPHHIQLSVSGFNEHDVFALRRVGNLLQVVYTPVSAGDFDLDGRVDADDLASWTTGFGNPTSGTHALGDADDDDDVDGLDFLVWQRLQGVGTNSELATNVPEPKTLLVMGLAFAARFLRPRLKLAAR